jgi:hypothetical protein
MSTYRELKKKINACAGRQMGKALFAFFMLSILETLVLSVFMTPVLLVSKEGRASVSEMIVTAISLYAGFIFILVLQYGYHVLIARLVRGNFVTLGFLFTGFRDRKRIFPAALLYAAGLTAALVICQVAAFMFNGRLSKFSARFGLPVFAVCVLSVFILLSLFILVKFTFVWLCLYDNPSAGVSAAFKRSVRLLHGKTFRLLGFILYAGGRRLVVAVIIFIAGVFIPQATADKHGILMFVFEFVYFVAAYSAVVRMFMSIPVFYDSIGGRPVKTDGNAGTPELSVPDILLPGPPDDTVTGK